MLPNKTCKKNAISGMEQDEHVISILLSLIRNVQGQQKERVLTKFLEKDMEKAERIVELHFFYKQRSSLSDSIISKEIEKSDDEPDEDEIYMKRLDGGLFVLQQIDLIILEVMYYAPVMLRERIHKLFEQQRVSIVTVKDVVVEFLQQLGDVLLGLGYKLQKLLERHLPTDPLTLLHSCVQVTPPAFPSQTVPRQLSRIAQTSLRIRHYLTTP